MCFDLCVLMQLFDKHFFEFEVIHMKIRTPRKRAPFLRPFLCSCNSLTWTLKIMYDVVQKRMLLDYFSNLLIYLTFSAKPVNKTGFIIVQDAKQSAEIAKHLIENPPSYIVVVDICRNVAGGRKNLCLLMLHVAEVDGNETYVYQLSDSKPSLMADRELHKVLKTCKTVSYRLFTCI